MSSFFARPHAYINFITNRNLTGDITPKEENQVVQQWLPSFLSLKAQRLHATLHIPPTD